MKELVVPKASLREKFIKFVKFVKFVKFIKFIKLKVNYELQMKKKKNSCKFLLFFRAKTSLRERNFFWGGEK